MVNYYDLKIEKYNKLIKSKSSDIHNIFLIDIKNKREIHSIINSIDSQVVEDYESTIKSDSESVVDALQQNTNIIRYKNIITEIKKKLCSDQFKKVMIELIKLMDELNTGNMNNIRIEILVYLILISKGSILLDVYKPFNFILKGHYQE